MLVFCSLMKEAVSSFNLLFIDGRRRKAVLVFCSLTKEAVSSFNLVFCWKEAVSSVSVLFDEGGSKQC